MEEPAAAIAILVASKLGAVEEEVIAGANKAASLHSYNQTKPTTSSTVVSLSFLCSLCVIS